MSTVVSMSDTSDHAAACGPPDRQAREWRTEKFLDDVCLGSPVGESPALCEVLRRAIQVAATGTTTCLQGESGVGKEVVARLIHRASFRCRGPFVAINCAPGAARGAVRVGAVWVRARRVHGSAPGEARTDRNGGGRGAVS